MKRVQRYILFQLAVATFISSAGLFFVVLPGVGVNAFAKLGAGGATAAIGFVPYVFGELAGYLLPFGFLMAVVVTFGRLAADNEWLAITLSGLHPMKALWPSILFAMLLGAAHLPLATDLAPFLKVRQRQYLGEALAASLERLNPGSTKIDKGDFHLTAVERDGDVFYDAIVHFPAGTSNSESSRTIRANMVRIRVEDGFLWVDLKDWVGREGNEKVVNSEASFWISADELLGGKKKKFRMKLHYYQSEQLVERIEGDQLGAEDLRIAIFELNNRRASSLTYLLFLIWGVPVGLMAQKRSMLSSFAITITFGMVYYVISIRFLRLAGYSGTLPAAVAAWATPVLGTLLGLGLWVKGLRPRR